MSNSRRSRATARASVGGTSWWASALLKGGGTMLDSMNAAVRNARVAVLPVKPRTRPAKAKRQR